MLPETVSCQTLGYPFAVARCAAGLEERQSALQIIARNFGPAEGSPQQAAMVKCAGHIYA